MTRRCSTGSLDSGMCMPGSSAASTQSTPSSEGPTSTPKISKPSLWGNFLSRKSGKYQMWSSTTGHQGVLSCTLKSLIWVHGTFGEQSVVGRVLHATVLKELSISPAPDFGIWFYCLFLPMSSFFSLLIFFPCRNLLLFLNACNLCRFFLRVFFYHTPAQRSYLSL